MYSRIQVVGVTDCHTNNGGQHGWSQKKVKMQRIRIMMSFNITLQPLNCLLEKNLLFMTAISWQSQMLNSTCTWHYFCCQSWWFQSNLRTSPWQHQKQLHYALIYHQSHPFSAFLVLYLVLLSLYFCLVLHGVL